MYVTAVHGDVMSSDFLKGFGQNVNDRGIKGVTLTWFTSTYSNYENGKESISSLNKLKLLEVLEFEGTFLFLK